MSDKFNLNFYQEVLFAVAPTLYKKINSTKSLKPKFDQDTVVIYNTDPSYLSDDNIDKILIKQNELLTTVSPINTAAALEAYADADKTNTYRESGYNIKNNILFTRAGQTYKFSIEDQINNKIPQSISQIPFYFKSITIENKSKDAFTVRSNYLVTFKIAFSFFEKIKEKLIEVKNVSGRPDKSLPSIALLNLVYPLYEDFTSLNPSDIPSAELLALRGGNGIVLQQSLDFASGSAGAFRENANKNPIITKNFHLTYYKHSFSFDPDQKPSTVPLKNELTISYIAYDSTNSSDVADSRTIPTFNENVYKKLQNIDKNDMINTTGVFIRDANNPLEILQGLIAENAEKRKYLEKVIACSSEIGNLDVNTKKKIGEFFGDEILQKESDDIKEEAEKARENLINVQKSFVYDLKLTLVEHFIVNLERYSFGIPKLDLVDFQAGSFWREAGKTFLGDLQVILPAAFIGRGVAKGIAGRTPTSAAGKAAKTAGGAAIRSLGTVATGLEIGRIVNKGLNSGDWSRKSITDLRNSIGTRKIKKINFGRSSRFVEDLRKKFSNTKDPKEKAEAIKKINEVFAGTYSDFTTEAIGFLGGATSDEEFDYGEDRLSKVPVPIKFTLFGSIVEFLSNIEYKTEKKTKFIFGGSNALYDKNNSAQNMFFSYYFIPIEWNSFLAFLNRKILDTEGLNYSAEAFLKDLINEIIKPALTNKSPYREDYNKYIPSNLTINSFIVNKEYDEFYKKIDNVDLKKDDSRDYQEIKQILNNSKNIIDKKIAYKVYTISAGNPIEKTNFYLKFNNKVRSDSAEQFQKFIISNYNIPCIRTKTVDQNGSILKTKNISFSRKDNANLTTGQLLDDNSLLRLPYEINGELKNYLFWFLDVGSNLFVAPVENLEGKINTRDIFGFSGLYFIRSITYEHNYNLDGNASKSPNVLSKVMFTGQLLSYGDGPMGDRDNETKTRKKATCKDPVAVSTEPAALQGFE